MRAPVSHSAHGDTVYTLIITVSEREGPAALTSYQQGPGSVLRRVRLRQRQSKILSVLWGWFLKKNHWFCC